MCVVRIFQRQEPFSICLSRCLYRLCGCRCYGCLVCGSCAMLASLSLTRVFIPLLARSLARSLTQSWSEPFAGSEIVPFTLSVKPPGHTPARSDKGDEGRKRGGREKPFPVKRHSITENVHRNSKLSGFKHRVFDRLVR